MDEASLRWLADCGLIAAFDWSIDGHITGANQRFLDLVGFSREDLAAGLLDWKTITPPAYHAMDEALLEELQAAGSSGIPIEKALLRKDGVVLRVVVAYAMLGPERRQGIAFVVDLAERDGGVRPEPQQQRHMVAITQVITATSSTLDLEKVLDAFLANLRSLSGADRVSVMLLDPSTDVLTATAARDAHGPLPGGLRLARGEGAAGRVMEQARPLVLPDVRNFPQFVPSRPPQQGSRGSIPQALSYAGFPLVSRGRVVGVASVVGTEPRDFAADDIALIETICRATAVSIDNALAHQALQQRAQKLTGEIAVHRSHAENVLSSITDGVATIGTDGLIASWNRGAETIMGYTAEEAIGRKYSEIFPDSSKDRDPRSDEHRLEETLRRETAQGRQALSSERKDGTQVALSMSAAPLYDEQGKVDGIVRIFHDSSRERSLLDSIQRASEAKSKFLANMSHEIRTPLNAILGFSQMMRREVNLSDPHRRYLEVINNSGEHLLALIDDILDMAKIEAGRSSLTYSNVKVASLVRELTNMFRMRAESKGVELVVRALDDVPPVLRTDERKVRQILVNLLGNAVKFTSHGAVRCLISVSTGAGHGLRLLADVDDTGPGIGARDAEAIFAPFEQTAAGVGAGGTGLGLAISRELARLMGGDVTVASELGRGSRFRLDIPVTVGSVKESTPVGLRRRVVGIRAGLGPFRILVVSGQADMRMLLVDTLKAVGFEARDASPGAEAVTLMSAWKAHAVLLDLPLAAGEELALLRQMRTTEGLERLPVIAIGASTSEADRLMLEAGASTVLRKPFRDFELLENVRAGLSIEYVYLTEATPEESSPGGAHPSDGSMDYVQLPTETVEQLRTAAYRAQYERLIDILEGVARSNPGAAAILRGLVERFDYAELIAVLDRVPD